MGPLPRGGPGRATWRTPGWLAAVAALAFALAGPALVPLLVDWGWTTPYDDAWIEITTRGLFPALLWPLFLAAPVALLAPLARRPRGLPDERLLLLAFGALAGAALASAGPALGVVDVRFVPLAQLSLALTGAAGLGLALARLALADVAALGLVLVAAAYADSRSVVLRHWVDWNYSGLEAKELWPAWKELNARLRGGTSDPRVAFEYGPVHERAGSLRMHETVPFFSGRSGIEGVYSQSSTTTHPVYYLLSELFPSSSNPFRSRSYSRFDLATGLARLRLFNVGQIVATSPALVEALEARPEVVREARIPPYTLYRMAEPGPGYVEPLEFAPVRSSPGGWRDQAYRWVSRKPPNRAVLVFTDDRRFDVVAADPWGPPPERPLASGVEVTSEIGEEEIRVTTSRPGHPLLVKVSYHPRWRVEGGSGPYLASPGLMLIVPSQREVRLAYVPRTWADHAGLALGASGVGILLAAALARRRGRAEIPAAARRALLPAALPVALLLALAALRLVPRPSHSGEAEMLYESASRAYAAEQWDEAAEYARHAVVRVPAGDSRRDELQCVRGEALLRAGHAREAVEAFTTVVEDAGSHLAQALHSGALAREAAGDVEGRLRGDAGSPRSSRRHRGPGPSRDRRARASQGQLAPARVPSISRAMASAAAAGSGASVIGRPTTR